MNELKEALAKLEEAKQMLSEAINNSLKGKSILSGKCAIQVNNEREFKLLMEHYESKGWRSWEGDLPTECKFPKYDSLISYSDSFVYPNTKSPYITDKKSKEYKVFNSTFYRVIPFSDFAAEVGIKPPVFVLTSEDGVPLYEGDDWWCATNEYENNKGIWTLWNPNEDGYKLSFNSVCFPDKYGANYKAFSTKEAAEAWIKEQNKPKCVILQEDTPIPCTVTKDFVYFNLTGYKETILGKEVFVIPYESVRTSATELEEIYKAYKSLQ